MRRGGLTGGGATTGSGGAGGATICPDGGPGIGGGVGCSNPPTLADVGAGDFHVWLEVQTTQTGRVAVANQRATCTVSPFWEVTLDDGIVVAEVCGGTAATDTILRSCAPANDGAGHNVALTRFAGTLTLYVDGAAVATGASTAVLGDLPPLVNGRDDACEPVNGTEPVVGVGDAECLRVDP